ncbi:hypothetical protein ACFY1V_23250 [Streptomyces sp. NPDC001255]|uniref:hypothetical protein n=1 Tax=Streptomyces sp. NPDC001255 TaxID=3364550 RepID=UPI003686AAC5
MRRRQGRRWTGATAGAVFALLVPLALVAQPAQAADRPAPPRVLPGLDPAWLPAGASPSTLPTGNAVRDFGTGGLAVGASLGVPAYWTGSAGARPVAHAVPLPRGWTGGVVNAVNADGLMVGDLTGPGTYAAFAYQKGARKLTLLPGGQSAEDVNDAGTVVGSDRSYEGGTTGLVWRAGALVRRLPLPGDGATFYHVAAINEAGTIAGQAERVVPGDGSAYERWENFPVVWPADGSAPVELTRSGAAGLYDYSQVRDIDAAGNVVGYDWTGPWQGRTPWTWSAPYAGAGTAASLPAGTTGATLEAVGPHRGVAVGTALAPGAAEWEYDTHQALYRDASGTARLLPPLAGDRTAEAYAVTDTSRAGGTALDTNGVAHAVVWRHADRVAR